MTPPRYNAPETTWLLTRRCSERRFFLRPDSFVTRAFMYVLGFAVSFYGIELHSVVVLSNHWHVVCTDKRGRKSEFLQFVHMIIARAINTFRSRREAFWSVGRPSMVRLVTPQDVLDKMVYVMLNPVRAGLVERVEDWPGLVTRPEDLLGNPIVTQAPRRFFDSKGQLGAATHLIYSRPVGFENLSDEEFVAILSERVREGEKALALERGNRPVLGAKKVCRQSWNSSPKSVEAQLEREPHIACRDKELYKSALAELRGFVTDYRSALAKYSTGCRGVLFPYGTLMMRTRFGVRCSSVPP